MNYFVLILESGSPVSFSHSEGDGEDCMLSPDLETFTKQILRTGSGSRSGICT